MFSVKNYDSVVILGASSRANDLPEGIRLLIPVIGDYAPVYFMGPDSKEKWSCVESSPGFCTITPDNSSPFSSMLQLLRFLKRQSCKKILFIILTDRYKKVIDNFCFPYAAIYYSEPGQSAPYAEVINQCSAIIAETEVQREEFLNDPAILPSVWLLDDFIEHAQQYLSSIDTRYPERKHFKKRVLVGYSKASCHVNTVREHLDAFSIFSKNEVTYVNATANEYISPQSMDSYDAVIVHYSVRISDPGHMSVHFFECLKNYKGAKLLFIQDEYDNLNSTYSYMAAIDFDVVYTVINEEHNRKLYPAEKFPYLRIVYNLTGYVPYMMDGFVKLPFSKKTTDVFYRGRDLPYQYGTLGVEKYEIGSKFKAACAQEGYTLNMDVESSELSRIYGDAWYKALSRAKTMLGTESGSNVFDMDGDLKELIELDKSQGLSYEEIYERRLRKSEEEWAVNMISPKIFEALMVGTVPVLYEGEYSNVITAGRHYISLKKDLSNISDVASQIQDESKLELIASTGYEEIIKNPQFSYSYFIKNLVDTVVDDEVLLTVPLTVVPSGIGYLNRRHEAGGITKQRFFERYIPSTISSAEAELISDFQWENRAVLYKIWQWIGRAERKFKRLLKINQV